MKICLINPPLKIEKAMEELFIFQPLGLAYLGAVLEKEHDVCIIDANAEGWDNVAKDGRYSRMGLSLEELKKRVRRLSPQIVVITVPFSINAQSAFEVASMVKSINHEVQTVLGGPHVSGRPAETLSHPDVDFVVIGEGEATMAELAERIGGGPRGETADVAGIGYKKNGEPLFTKPRGLIGDLDTIPFPARHLLPMEKYFEAFEKGPRQLYTYHRRWASFFTSRGCPFDCNFCSIHLTMGKAFRARTPENVNLEIDQLVNRFGIRHINFEDDNFTFNKKRVQRICDHIIERGHELTWSTPNGVRADIVDEELVAKMAASGCRRVFVAPESGVQRVVTEIIGKNMDLGKVEQAVRLFKKHRITVDGSFVIGSIGETKSDIWKTIKYAMKLKRLGMKTAGFHIATPLYKTRLYEEAKNKGYLKNASDDDSMATNRPLIETPEWTGDELRSLQSIANWLVNYNLAQKLSGLVRQKHRVGPFIRTLAGRIFSRRDIKETH